MVQRRNTVNHDAAAHQNIASVPTTVRIFISRGAATSSILPTPFATALLRSDSQYPISSSLTMIPTVP